MTVRIVDDKPDPRIVKRRSCEHCGVKVEYVPIDVKERNGHDYGGGPDGCRYIECPKCKNWIILESW